MQYIWSHHAYYNLNIYSYHGYLNQSIQSQADHLNAINMRVKKYGDNGFFLQKWDIKAHHHFIKNALIHWAICYLLIKEHIIHHQSLYQCINFTFIHCLIIHPIYYLHKLRDIPIQQQYEKTALSRSDVRPWDQM